MSYSGLIPSADYREIAGSNPAIRILLFAEIIGM